MAEASIPVDLLNPGQVFACIGLLETADQLLGDAEGAFDWRAPAAVRFHLQAGGDACPVAEVLGFLERAVAVAEAVNGSQALAGWIASWGPTPSVFAGESEYPFPDPDSPATLVCALVADGQRIQIDHWGDATTRDNVKFWAGSRGYPGAALARDALALIRGKAVAAAADPFALVLRPGGCDPGGLAAGIAI